MDSWLVLDCNFLCYRARYSTGELTHNGVPTGTTFGFLTSLVNLQEAFQADYVVFCFDLGEPKRKTLLPCYKANRHKPPKEVSEEEKEELEKASKNFRIEVKRIRKDTLPRMGYKNILSFPGYEADDWIAYACETIQKRWPEDEVIIVSADHDLYQCLSGQVRMYNPCAKQVVTLQGFKSKYGILPSNWALVKAISGCRGDNIPGIDGVGESTAIKFLLGGLPKTSKKRKSIELGSTVIERNIPLVSLPFAYITKPPLKKSLPDIESWRTITKELGMDTLIFAGPYVSRRTRHDQ